MILQKRVSLVTKLTCIGLLYFLTGCATIGPDYKGPPEIDIPEAWNHQIQSNNNTKSNVDFWWTRLQDETLNNLLSRADSSNLDIKIALSRIEQAKHQYGVVLSQNYPNVDAVGVARRSQNSENFIPLPRNQSFGVIGASLGWELDVFGRVRRQKESSKAYIESTVEQYRDIKVSLFAEIANTYINIRTLQKRLQLANKNVANQEKSLQIVKARYEAELTSELDVNQAKQNLAHSQSIIPILNGTLSKSINYLAVLLGEHPGALNKELEDVKVLPKLPTDITISIPRDVIRQRPDIRLVERQLAAQTAQIGVTKANLYPRLSLSGLFGLAASSGNIFSAASNSWSFGPNLSWNIFSANRNKNLVNIEQTKTNQARLAYEKTVLSAFLDVETSLINFEEEKKRLDYLKTSVIAAQKTVDIAKSQYINGLTNFQTVLDAERILFAEEDRLSESQGASIKYFVGIYRAMGGGWQNKSTNKKSNTN